MKSFHCRILCSSILLTVITFGPIRAETEASTRQTDPTQAVSAKAVPQEAASAQTRTVEQLRTEIKGLRELLATLISRLPEKSSQDSLLQTLASDIEMLKLENQLLRDMLEGGRQQYVSTDEDGFQTAAGKETIDKLASNILAVNEKLDSYMNHKYQTPPASSDAEASTHPLGLDLTGFVDASGSSDNVTRGSSFSLNQLEIDLERSFDKRATVRADIEYAPSDGEGFSLNLEQGYVTYAVDARGRFVGTFGKFNAPIGYEMQDAPENYMYSYGYIFSLALPTNLTGFMGTATFSRVLDWKVYLVNGWDLNADNNKSKTLGSRFGITPHPSANFGFSVLSGAEQPDNGGGRRTVFDLDMTIMPGGFWCLGADFTSGSETGMPATGAVATFQGSDLSGPHRQPGFFSVTPRDVNPEPSPHADGTITARWTGLMLASHFHVSESFGIHARFDYFNDRDGWRTGLAQELKAFAVAPSLTIIDGLVGLTEFRYDWSNRPYFSSTQEPGRASMFSTALQFVYGF